MKQFPLGGEPTYTEVRNEALPPVQDLENELWRMHREMHQAAQSRDGAFNYSLNTGPRSEAAAAADSNRARERAALRRRPR